MVRRNRRQIDEPWSRVQSEAQVRQSARTVRTRFRGSVRVAMSLLLQGPARLRVVHMLERKRKLVQRVGRARLPGFRERRGLGFLLELLAEVFLGMEQRRNDQPQQSGRGEEHCPTGSGGSDLPVLRGRLERHRGPFRMTWR